MSCLTMHAEGLKVPRPAGGRTGLVRLGLGREPDSVDHVGPYIDSERGKLSGSTTLRCDVSVRVRFEGAEVARHKGEVFTPQRLRVGVVGRVRATGQRACCSCCGSRFRFDARGSVLALPRQHDSKERVDACHEGTRDRVTHVNRSNLLAMPRGCYQHPPGSVFCCVMNASTPWREAEWKAPPMRHGGTTHGRGFSSPRQRVTATVRASNSLRLAPPRSR